MKKKRHPNSKTFSEINYTIGQSPKATEIETNKWDLVKLNKMCTASETINKMKR